MIIIKSKNIVSSTKKSFFELLEKKDRPSDDELLREDFAIICIEQPEFGHILNIGSKMIECNLNWWHFFPAIDMEIIESELKYWHEELIRNRKIVKIENYIKNNRQSRRMIVSFWNDRFRNINSKKCSCITYVYFRIVNEKLEMHSHARANNMFFLVFVDLVILSQIQKILARRLNLECGKYVHFVDSLHFYRKDIKEINKQAVYMKNSKFWQYEEKRV